MQKNSMLMAVEDLNSGRRAGSTPLSLDIRDSGGQARKARAIIDHFVKDKQYAVTLGGFTSSVAASLADKCEQRQIPLLIITGSEDSITLQGYRYVFRVAPPRSRYPAAALQFARTRFRAARIALVTERSSYGESMSRIMTQAAREEGWVLSGELKFAPGSRNFEELLSSLKEASPEIVFLTAFPPDGARIIGGLRKMMGETPIINLAPASVSAGSYSRCGKGCRGVMNPSLWQPGAVRSGVRYFERYEALFGIQPDYHGAQAYAAVVAAARALAKAGAAQPEPVREALEGMVVDTPYGKVSFSDWGGFTNQNNPLNYLVQWTGKDFEVIWPERP
jgi:branched-chain amino acid transport system substrate-binding protein